MSEWISLECKKPKNGQTVQGGWFANGRLEYEIGLQWMGDNFYGGWTPTHWKHLPEPPA